MRIYKKSLRHSRDLKRIICIINTIKDMLCEQTYTVYTHKHKVNSMISYLHIQCDSCIWSKAGQCYVCAHI